MFGRGGPVVDPAGGDPTARALVGALAGRDWRTARDVLNAPAGPDARAFLLEAAADVDGVQEWIPDWIAAEPASSLPLLVGGCHAVAWAWRARGRKDAGLEESYRRLAFAEQVLGEVVRRDPDDVTAWAFLVGSGRGLHVGQHEASYRFEQVVRRVPDHVLAHEQRLQFLCEKWAGTNRRMFAFARESLAAARPGSLLPVLLPQAHLEMAASLPPDQRTTYLSDPLVLAEIHLAAHRSVLSPACVRATGWARRAAVFALAFSLAGDHAAAVTLFEALGDQADPATWSYLDPADPSRAFLKTRKFAYAHHPAA